MFMVMRKKWRVGTQLNKRKMRHQNVIYHQKKKKRKTYKKPKKVADKVLWLKKIRD